ERMQRLLLDEATAEIFFTAIRGERAGAFSHFDQLSKMDGPIVKHLAGDLPKEPSWWDTVDFRLRKMVDRSNAWLLDNNTKIVAAAKLPAAARVEAIRKIEFDGRGVLVKEPFELRLAYTYSPASSRIAESERRTDTLLTCAATAIAAERFRLKHE